MTTDGTGSASGAGAALYSATGAAIMQSTATGVGLSLTQSSERTVHVDAEVRVLIAPDPDT